MICLKSSKKPLLWFCFCLFHMKYIESTPNFCSIDHVFHFISIILVYLLSYWDWTKWFSNCQYFTPHRQWFLCCCLLSHLLKTVTQGKGEWWRTIAIVINSIYLFNFQQWNSCVDTIWNDCLVTFKQKKIITNNWFL